MIDLWLFLLIFRFQIFLQTPTYIPGLSTEHVVCLGGTVTLLPGLIAHYLK